MVRTVISVKVKPEEKELLRKVAREMGLTTSQLVKRALYHYLRLYYTVLSDQLRFEVVKYLVEEGLL